MKQFLKDLFSAPFQLVLVVSFSVVGALAIAMSTWTISRTIIDYLADAMNERVARDMQLAQAFYSLKLREIEGVTRRLSKDALVIKYIINQTIQGDENAQTVIDQQIANNLSGLAMGGNHLIAVLNQNGDLLAGRLLSVEGQQSKIGPSGNWISLRIIQQSLLTEKPIAATEVIPPDLLTQVGLADQARIAIIDTPRAAPELFDPREGTAGLALTSVSQEVSQVVLNQGKEYVGLAFVVNENYITRYEPLINHNGEEIGILYAGAKQASFYRLVNIFNQRIILVALGTIILTIVLTTPVSRAITRPLNQLKDLVEANRRVAGGDMSVRVPVRAGGQIGLLERL